VDKPMRKMCAVVLIVSLVGCATTQGNIPRDTEADKKYDCSRFEAAWNIYTSDPVFNPVNLTNSAIEKCKQLIINDILHFRGSICTLPADLLDVQC
jgi:type IV pilus biogenesis protein CpaD/CtpE